MKAEESVWTLWTTEATPARTLRLLYLRPLGHKINGMLARQALDSRYIRMKHLGRT